MPWQRITSQFALQPQPHSGWDTGAVRNVTVERPSYSVHFWPALAGPSRLILHVASDVEACRFRATQEELCVHSARTGARVRNLRHVTVSGRPWLVFEPEEGPGEYEVYTQCEQASLEAEATWQSAHSTSALMSLPPALLIRRESRDTILGPPWPTDEGTHGVHRQSIGNVRARINVSASDMTRGGAVRALIPWRRRHGPLDAPILLAHHSACQPSCTVLSLSTVEKVSLVSSSREIGEIIFDTSPGPGEYVLYYLPYTARWEAYDARDDLYGTSYHVARHVPHTTAEQVRTGQLSPEPSPSP